MEDSAEARNRNDVPRRVVVETLVFAGLRISEFCGLDAHHLDVAAGRLRVPRGATKTDAGERVIPIVPALRERLTEHRMDYPVPPASPAFPTRNGTRQNPDNVRSRVLNPVRERANELLAADGRPPIGHMTPHTLRRTFASVVAVCDVSPRRAMYLMGHTDPTLTLGVYQQVMDVADGALGPPRRPHRMLSGGGQGAPGGRLATCPSSETRKARKSGPSSRQPGPGHLTRGSALRGCRVRSERAVVGDRHRVANRVAVFVVDDERDMLSGFRLVGDDPTQRDKRLVVVVEGLDQVATAIHEDVLAHRSSI